MKDGSFIERRIGFKTTLFCFVLRMVDTLKYLNNSKVGRKVKIGDQEQQNNKMIDLKQLY